MAEPRVFISHATADTEFAERFAGDLRNLGADVWLDSSHMGSGDFVQRINRALLERDVVILILSPAALTSQWVSQEFNAAITRAHQGFMRPPLVVLAQPCPLRDIPPLWTVYHRHDATSNYTAALSTVARELGLLVPAASQSWPSASPSAPALPTSGVQLEGSTSQVSTTSSTHVLLRLAARQPVATAVGLALVYILLDPGLTYLQSFAQRIWGFRVGALGSLLVQIALIATLTTLFGWREAGFRKPFSSRPLLLAVLVVPVSLLPLAISLLLPALLEANIFHGLSDYLLIPNRAAYELTLHSVWFGMVLATLLSLGPRRAILSTVALYTMASLLMDVFQTFQLGLHANTISLTADMAQAAAYGLVYASLRLRTGTIWFGIGLSLVIEFALIGWGGDPSVFYTVCFVMAGLLLIIGILLARPLLFSPGPSYVPAMAHDVANTVRY